MSQHFSMYLAIFKDKIFVGASITIKSTTVSVLKSFRLHSILYIITQAKISVGFAVCVVCLTMCVYVCMCCMCVHVCMYIFHVCIALCVYVCVCVCVCVHACVCMYNKTHYSVLCKKVSCEFV